MSDDDYTMGELADLTPPDERGLQPQDPQVLPGSPYAPQPPPTSRLQQLHPPLPVGELAAMDRLDNPTVSATVDPATLGIIGRGLRDAAYDTAKGFFGGVGGAVEQYGQTGEYNPKPIVDATMQTAAFGLPFASEGSLGIFGGRLAKTADLAALKRAEDAASAGAPAEQIFKSTGWFQGADKKWRFEIPDTAAKYAPPPPNSVTPLDQVLQHDPLYKAYPQLRNIETSKEDRNLNWRGSYQPGSESGDPAYITYGGAERLGDAPGTPRSTLLHEGQHAVQDIEGFGQGGNSIFLKPNTPAWDIYKERLAAMHNPLNHENFSAFAGYDGLAPRADYQKYLEAVKKPPPFIDRAAQEYAAKEGYRRMAGEVEARNVQGRADMPPEQLRESFPPLTQDTPTEQQFVSFRDPAAGPQLSEEFKPGGMGIRAYHGSPHDFDGHGLYFAENPQPDERGLQPPRSGFDDSWVMGQTAAFDLVGPEAARSAANLGRLQQDQFPPAWPQPQMPDQPYQRDAFEAAAFDKYIYDRFGWK